MKIYTISLLKLQHQKDFQSHKQNALAKTGKLKARVSNRKSKGAVTIYIITVTAPKIKIRSNKKWNGLTILKL